MSETKDIVERLEHLTLRYGAESEDAAARRRLQTRDDAIAEITALRSALRECSDDLAKRIDLLHPGVGVSAAVRRRREEAMAPVLRARALLGKEGA